MKSALTIFSILIVCNISFSQEKKTELALENQTIDEAEEPVFKFHPNPVVDDLFVIGTHKIKSIEIIDAFGTSVALYQFDKSIIRMNLSELKSGIYLLKVIDKHDRQDIKKLVVQ
ncbi:T9SS type A sorting domain-containing protein [Psychroserpens jangbogonensis]|uniref:T9SS type A sorting domain-containing protein n=1 Tax=Psychroserpens jangbogonensis TaxID=1484460 RepID=UPI00053E2A38|nr:T9SS type A sorting domain-containing protein [Psychroserpens jangbogonensis]